MARPQEFDREEVIKNASAVFHRQGYGATSIPDLVKATGLQPGSLYAAFKSKKGILIESLKDYTDEHLRQINEIFEAASSPLAGVRNFLMESGRVCGSEQGNYGCFMVNNLLEMAPQDEEVTAVLSDLLERIEKRMAVQLRKAQEKGEISRNKNPDALAKFIMTSMWGIRVLSKTGPSQNDVMQVVEQIASVLDACTES